MKNFAPIARIILRYIIGATFVGSTAVGETLAADPDLVAISALAIGALVEGWYSLARRWGWAK